MTRPSRPRRLAPLAFALGFSLLMANVPAAEDEAPARLTPSLRPELRHDLNVEALESGEYVLETLGEDPFLQLEPEVTRPEDSRLTVLAFEYFCPDGVQGVEFFYGPPVTAAHAIAGPDLPAAQGWLPYAANLQLLSDGRWNPSFPKLRLDLGRRAGVTLRLRNLQMRAPTAEEMEAVRTASSRREAKARQARLVRDLLAANFPCHIRAVEVTPTHLVIRAVATDEAAANVTRHVRLAELRPDHAAWQLGDLDFGGLTTFQANASSPGEWTWRVARHEDGRDRVTSRWCLVEPDAGGVERLASHPVYATSLEGSGAPDLERPRADSKKGLAGVWLHSVLPELMELGVRHVTVNVWISDLLTWESGRGRRPFEYGGRRYYVNERREEQYDRMMRFGTTNGMVISAIILVGQSRETGTVAGQLAHPEAESAGHYAMPDVSTAKGAEVYEAVLAYLAERYAQPGDPHGRVSNWIMHNEVDYGWEWTNMGAQPEEIYFDTYVRSMRLAYYQARRFNPHARVFISLTHRWATPEDPTWKTYAPRRLLERLQVYCRLEGDFDWGVAYHPYPQSLFEADTWNDELPEFNFDTPLITMKNIEVLDAFLHRPEMRRPDGSTRRVLLSEQGFHTPDYGEAAQQRQAAALVYTWHKIRPLKTIETFHNHRWIDHPHEGGLKLGLRTLPDAEHPDGRRKFAWSVYQALETESEAASTDFARKLIGIRSFEDIPYRGAISDSP